MQSDDQAELAEDVAYPDEWRDILGVLRGFRFDADDILAPGGRKTKLADRIDGHFYKLG